MRDCSSNLVVENLSAAYERNGEALDVFTDVSFTVEPGEVLGFFGSNGCGKSTLLRVIAGLKAARSGYVRLPCDAACQHGVAILPQDFRTSFFTWISLKKNIRMTLPRPLRHWRRQGTTIERVRREFGIDLDMRLRPQACSGGMLQQAAMIRAFAKESRILLADEPFSALDVNIAGRIRRAFTRLVREKRIIALVVLHDLEDIVEVCDRVLVIPKMPFATCVEQNSHLARIIENVNRDAACDELKALSFVELAERMLGRQETRNVERQTVPE